MTSLFCSTKKGITRKDKNYFHILNIFTHNYSEMNYQPREIYHQITPIRNIKQAKAYLKCSLDDSHEH